LQGQGELLHLAELVGGKMVGWAARVAPDPPTKGRGVAPQGKKTSIESDRKRGGQRKKSSVASG